MNDFNREGGDRYGDLLRRAGLYMHEGSGLPDYSGQRGPKMKTLKSDFYRQIAIAKREAKQAEAESKKELEDSERPTETNE